ncbi:hypothetical protein shim_37490 [Shimia sp. SK013]|uniref:hypothetical protein n=1 Tax=Shimia sp. SK013 TaxID=1389006 RepID=UPI0006B68835|nr:hypothetical protein [Shimia sp. SK013]KPA19790.1 hypothetical protein shim_37490 [Shimia sp. SK013]
MKNFKINRFRALAGSASALCMMAGVASADIVHVDDVIIQFSLCVGNDCVNGESFGFDTIRMKENNTRLNFDDTSSSASFPNNDWRLIANDSSNGGANYLAIEDSTAGRIPFRVEAGAPSNALVVEADGDIGISTINPVVDIHVVEGNTPTLRLEQDGSDGFTPQTYDVAANETNFFIRDVTNGSKLVFRAKPGAPTDSLFIAANGDIGIGTDAPGRDLHIRSTSQADAQQILLENTAAGAVQVRMETTLASNRRFIGTSGGSPVSQINFGDSEVTIAGPSYAADKYAVFNGAGLTINGTGLTVPDYVFEDDYDLRSLSQVQAFIDENGHLPDVPSASEINTNGLNMNDMQLTLLRKVEELTLYTLSQQAEIERLLEAVE